MKFTLILLLCLVGLFSLFIYWAKKPLNTNFAKNPSAIIKTFEPVKLSEKPENLTLATLNLGFASGKKNNKGHLLKKEEVAANLKAAAETLQKLNPDVVLLQEVDFGASRTYYQDQAKFLSKKLKLPYVAMAITWNLNYLPWPYWPPRLHYGPILSGQAVLSRYPLENQSLIFMEKPTKNPFWYNWFYLERLVQRLTLKLPQENFTLYNAHLEAFDHQHRATQLQTLRKQLQEDFGKHLIVAGDFNEDDPDLKLFHETDFKITYPSFPSWEPKDSIDQIHGRTKNKVLEQGSLNPLNASDHLMVWVRIKLP